MMDLIRNSEKCDGERQYIRHAPVTVDCGCSVMAPIPHQGQGQRLDHKYIHKMGVEWCVLFILCDKTKILFMLVFMLNVPL